MTQPTSSTILKGIGENAANDYLLDLDTHISRYQDVFPAFTALMKNSEIEYIADRYHTYDQEALSWQKRYRNYATWLRWSTFAAAAFSATMIMAGTLGTQEIFQESLENLPKIILIISTILTIVFSGASTTLLMLIKRLRLLEKWMGNRAKAEDYRIQYFEQIAEDLPTEDTRMASIYLEYFRRYQLDIQLAYYQQRSTNMEKKSMNSAIWIAVLAGLVIIINGIIGSLGLKFTFLVTATLIIQAYSAMISNKESGEQNERNASRYKKQAEDLGRISSSIDRMRASIQNGKTEVIKQFLEAIHQPMRAENQQWLETMQASSGAIEELEKQLEAIDVNTEKTD